MSRTSLIKLSSPIGKFGAIMTFTLDKPCIKRKSKTTRNQVKKIATTSMMRIRCVSSSCSNNSSSSIDRIPSKDSSSRGLKRSEARVAAVSARKVANLILRCRSVEPTNSEKQEIINPIKTRPPSQLSPASCPRFLSSLVVS